MKGTMARILFVMEIHDVLLVHQLVAGRTLKLVLGLCSGWPLDWQWMADVIQVVHI